MKMKGTRTVAALLLIVTMLTSAILPGGLVFASNAEPDSMKMEFVEVNANNTMVFTGKLSDESALPKVTSSLYMVQVTVDGNKTETVAINAANSPTVCIYPSYFSTGKLPETSLVIAKDAIVQEAKRESGQLVAVQGGNSYKLSEGMMIEKGLDGTWSQKDIPTLGSVALEFVEVNTNNTMVFTGKLSDESALPKVTSSLYMVQVTVDGNKTETVAINAANSPTVCIYPSYFSTGTLPESSLVIAKDAIVQEAKRESGQLVAVQGGKTYNLSEELAIEKGQDGTWSKKTTAQPPQPTESVKLEFVEFMETVDPLFKFTGTMSDESALPKGHYLVQGSIDGGNTVFLHVYAEDTYIRMNESYFPNKELPTGTLTFAKDAIIQQAERDANQQIVAVQGGKTYKLSEELSLEKGQDGTWSKKTTAQPPQPTESVKMEFVEFMETTDPLFKFTGTMSDESALPKGHYLVQGSIDGGNTVFLHVYAEDTYIRMNQSYFPNKELPTGTLTFAKDAIIQQAERDANQQIVAVQGGKTYKLSEEMALEKGQDDTWSKKNAGQTPKPPQQPMGNVTLEFTDGTSGNFKFNANLSDGKALPKSSLYMVKAIVDGTEQIIAINAANSPIAVVYNATTYYEKGKAPTDSLIIQKGAIVQEATRDNDKFLVPTGENIYSLSEEMAIEKDSDGTWFQKGHKPVVPEIPANMDSVNIAFTLVNNKNDFNFSWAEVDGTEVEKGYYTATIKVDGADRKVIFGGTGAGVWIYYHCFTVPPNGTNPKVPTDTLTIPAGTVLTPVVKDKWTTVRTDGSYYKINNELSIKNYDGVWGMEASSHEQPLEVKVSFKEIKQGALYLNVETPDGTAIGEIYNINKQWSGANSVAIRGIADENNQFTYTKEVTRYNIVPSGLYLGALELRALDEVKIEAGTIVYPVTSTQSYRPIKIINSFRMFRDAEDKWTSDNIGQDVDFSQTSSGNSTSPKTGDTHPVMAWILLMSCAGLSIILINKRKQA